MESYSKLDLISLAISVLIHAFVLGALTLKLELSPKSYQVVSVVPLTFDQKVDSDLVGLKSSKGKELKRESSTVSLPSKGSSSKRVPQSLASNKVKTEKRGEVKNLPKFGAAGITGSVPLSSKSSGSRRGFLSLKVDVPGKSKANSSLRVSFSKLTPYLLSVRDKIMSNWELPYYKTSSLRKAVVSLIIDRKGNLCELNIVKFSQDIAFNRSVVSAIYKSTPFKPFPKGVKLKQVNLKVYFELR
ncbi:TonB C-terminal domain-containing protein [Thermovibrio sp.]